MQLTISILVETIAKLNLADTTLARSWPTLAKPTLASVSVLVVWPTLAKTDFGQTDFGHNRLWPQPTLVKTDFGQIEFDLLCVVLCCFVLCVVCVAWVLVSWFHVWVLVSRFGVTALPGTALPLDRPSPGPPFPGTAQNFALFFPLPPQNSFFSSLSWRSSPKPPGLHTTAREPKRAHLSAPALQTPPKFHEKTPREGRKERILWREREKSAKFWAPHPSDPHLQAPTFSWVWAPTLLVPTFRPPLFLGLGPHPSAPTLRAPHSLAPAFSGFGPLAYIKKPKKSKQLVSNILNFNFGQSRFGQSRF